MCVVWFVDFTDLGLPFADDLFLFDYCENSDVETLHIHLGGRSKVAQSDSGTSVCLVLAFAIDWVSNMLRDAARQQQ